MYFQWTWCCRKKCSKFIDFQWNYNRVSMISLYKIIENPCFSTIIFGNITSIENTFQNRILQNPSRISYPFCKTLSRPNITLWEAVSSLQLAQFRLADPEHFCQQTIHTLLRSIIINSFFLWSVLLVYLFLRKK